MKTIIKRAARSGVDNYCYVLLFGINGSGKRFTFSQPTRVLTLTEI